MYILLTDGAIHDISDALIECKKIKSYGETSNASPPLLFAIGLGAHAVKA